MVRGGVKWVRNHTEAIEKGGHLKGAESERYKDDTATGGWQKQSEKQQRAKMVSLKNAWETGR